MTPTYDGPLAGIPTDEETVRKLDRTFSCGRTRGSRRLEPPTAR